MPSDNNQAAEEQRPTPRQTEERRPQPRQTEERHPAARQAEERRPQPRQTEERRPASRQIEERHPQPRQTEEKRPDDARQTAVRRRGRRPGRPRAGSTTPVRIIPLGGIGEIGKNMTAYECNGDIFVVDCGTAFPDDDLLGVDLVIPDISWLLKNRENVKGIVLTHGHEDHIGALPYVLRELNVPVYGTRLTLGLVEGKLKEHGLAGHVKLVVENPGDVIKLGCMSVEFIHVNHSIADAVALAITTPAGVIVQTGDFKIDSTPIQGKMIDLARLGELGKKGVLALLSDSTNAERRGFTMSERKVGETFNEQFFKAQGKRLIIATFSSNIDRVQQIVNAAVAYGRKVAISGRSMVNVCGIAMEMGYLNIPEDVLVDIDAINRYPQDKLVIITTGSQGEPMSALYRMAFSDHRQITVGPNDYIILSASAIPGNEKTISKVINELMKLGAEVVYESMAAVHVSGHACQEELKIVMALVNPKYFIPVHGEMRHLKRCAHLALEVGVPPQNIILPEIGRVMELRRDGFKNTETVPAGRVLVDGLGVGDVGSIVLRDRKHLAQDGLIVVVATIDRESGALIAGPDIVSRGFVYVREAEGLIEQTRELAKKVLDQCQQDKVTDWGSIKTRVKEVLSKQLYDKTKRSPMILPVIMEV